MEEMEFLASGRDADVYALDERRVLRRYRRPRPIESEVTAMRIAGEAGYPVPEVHEATSTEMVLDRVEGPTMLEVLTAEPATIEPHAATLATLHKRLGRIRAPESMPSRLGEGGSLLHLDLHPGNVILSSEGPVVIDWTNAARGPAEADPAAIWLLLSVVLFEGPEEALNELTRPFLDSFLTHFDSDGLTPHFPAIGATRLQDPNMSPDERNNIRRFLSELA